MRVMSFVEFRSAENEPFGEAVRQQRELFRDETAADSILRPDAIALGGWGVWEENGVPSET